MWPLPRPDGGREQGLFVEWSVVGVGLLLWFLAVRQWSEGEVVQTEMVRELGWIICIKIYFITESIIFNENEVELKITT